MSATVQRPPSVVHAPRAERLNLRGHLGLWIIRVLLIFFCVVVVAPAFWVISASVQKGSSAFTSSLWPTTFTWDNYGSIKDQGFFTWLKNSLIVCISAGVLSMSFNVMGAYAFSRLRFWGSRRGLLALFLLQAFPAIVALPAIYTLLIDVNLLDTLYGVILVFIGGSAYTMWLMKTYIDGLPRELDEAAMVDGANTWQVFVLVLLPLLRPILVTIFIFSFAGTYNDFVLSSLILETPTNYTVTVGLFHVINGQFGTNWAIFSAGAVLASIPILIIFLSLQRQLVSGLAAGSVKG